MEVANILDDNEFKVFVNLNFLAASSDRYLTKEPISLADEVLIKQIIKSLVDVI